MADWQGQTAVVIASGPSLTSEQAEHAKASGAKTIVVNTSFRMLPTADVLFALDFLWWKTHIAEVKRVFKGQLWTTDNASRERFALNRVPGPYASGLGTKHVHTNGNSGAAAINLAFLFGSRKVLLLGFDMKEGPKGEKHFHGDHPAPMVQKQQFHEWIHKMKTMADDAQKHGLEIVNCTPDSALPYFRRSTIQEELT